MAVSARGQAPTRSTPATRPEPARPVPLLRPARGGSSFFGGEDLLTTRLRPAVRRCSSTTVSRRLRGLVRQNEPREARFVAQL
jgi:hypothetical protein